MYSGGESQLGREKRVVELAPNFGKEGLDRTDKGERTLGKRLSQNSLLYENTRNRVVAS
jgi:hypothetical protein